MIKVKNKIKNEVLPFSFVRVRSSVATLHSFSSLVVFWLTQVFLVITVLTWLFLFSWPSPFALLVSPFLLFVLGYIYPIVSFLCLWDSQSVFYLSALMTSIHLTGWSSKWKENYQVMWVCSKEPFPCPKGMLLFFSCFGSTSSQFSRNVSKSFLA